MIYKILDHLNLLESSDHDPPRSPPYSELIYEPIYDDMPYEDEITFPGP